MDWKFMLDKSALLEFLVSFVDLERFEKNR